MSWIIENKEWLLSGVLVVVPLTIIGWLLVGRRGQYQRGGDRSTNIQAAGDVRINTDKKPNDD